MARRVRSHLRNVALICVALLSTVLCAASAAQDVADYGRLLDHYQAGRLDEAVSQLALWPRADVTAAVKVIAKMTDAVTASAGAAIAPPRLRVAVMLHTDMAAALLSSDTALSDFHFDAARHLVGLLHARQDQDSSALEFVRRWYAFAPSLFLATHNLDRASWIVREGLIRLPGDPILYLYRGTIVELSGAIQTTVVTRSRAFSTAPGPPRLPLESAANDYRLALSVDPHLAAARLRLGWVHFWQHDSRARRDLETTAADASDAPTRYLAHLFLGALAEREKRPGDALREYEEARTAGPQYQTAYIAIVRACEALGDAARARATAATFVGLDKREDPWWDYNLGGLNMSALDWLRSAAQRP